MLEETIGPNNFDPFANLLQLNEDNVMRYTKDAHYIVTFSEGYIDNLRRLLAYSSGSMADLYESEKFELLLTDEKD